MTKASDNAFPSLLITESTEPTAPAAGKQRLYIDSTSHKLKATNSSGTERDIEDNPMTTAGDIIYGGASGVPTRLASAGATTKWLRGANAASPTWEFPPGYELGYDQITGNVTVSATTSAGATSVIAGSSYTYENVPYVFEFFSPSVNTPAASPGFIIIGLFEDGTSVGNIATIYSQLNTANIRVPVTAQLRRTPSAGAHTYAIKAYRDGGASTATIVAGAAGADTAVPAFLRIRKA